MSEIENLRDREGALLVLIRAASDPGAVMRAVSRAAGGRSSVVKEIALELGVDEFWAEIIAGMSVSQFSPGSLQSLREEHAELDERIRSMSAGAAPGD